MLTSLRLCNFKSWSDTGEMRLAPITGLFGTNSSGKTSILQLLLLLKQSAESTDRAQVLELGDGDSYAELGTFRDAVHRHATAAMLEWSLAWSLPDPLTITNPLLPSQTLFTLSQLSLAARVRELGVQPALRLVVDWFAYGLSPAEARENGDRFGMVRKDGRVNEYDIIADEYVRRYRGAGYGDTLTSPIKFYGFPAEVYAAYDNLDFLARFQLAFENLMERMFYLGPLREPPKRQYLWAGTRPTDVGRRGERAIDALLAAHASEAQGELTDDPDHPVSWIVGEQLKALGLVDAFQVRPLIKGSSLFQVGVQTTMDAAPVLLPDVGFGVSQILPVLVLCYYAPRGSTIILEQPEIHLHPSVQAGLADVLIDAIKTRNIQIILESHSEHLLRRLQRRIAEEQLRAEDTALYFCEMQGGASRLTPLDVDEFGSINNWPKGFFGDEMGDLFAMTDAAMKRQMAQSGA